MIKSRDEIDDALEAIQQELKETVRLTLDFERQKNLSLKILDLTSDVAKYLNSLDGGLSPWIKSQLVGAVNTLNWRWQFAATNHLLLALVPPEEVSERNKYEEEIIKLSFDDLMKHIDAFKKHLERE